MQKILKCSECKNRHISWIGSFKWYCHSPKNEGKYISTDRNPIKSSPKWCPLREVKGDQNANKI